MCERVTATIILAAGQGSRMGGVKQVLAVDGTPLVRRAALEALALGAGPVVVVLGAHEAQVRSALDGLDVCTVNNAKWQDGIGSSIRAGLDAIVDDERVDGLLVMLVDQPRIDRRILAKLLEPRAGRVGAHGPSEAGSRERIGIHRQMIVACRYAGTLGVPAYFDRDIFPELLSLDGERGCKPIILRNPARTVVVECNDAELDLDTPEDWHRFTSEGASTATILSGV